MNRSLLFLGALLLGAKAMATPVVSVAQVDSRPDSDLPPAVFGGTEKKFNFKIEGTAGMQNGIVRVELFALAGGLAMPIGQPTLVTGVSLPGRCQIPVSFPEVKTETDLVLRLSAVAPAAPTPVLLTRMVFCVYPRDLDRQIQALLPPLPNGDARLVVFGAGPQLRTALHAMQISFSDAGRDLPSRFLPERIYLGDVTNRDAENQAHDRDKGARVAVFVTDHSLPSGVYADHSTDETYILVTAPILPTLADDPRSQLTLLKVIQSLTSN